MADIAVLINGIEYSAVDCNVSIGGVPVFGISKIEASEEQEKVDLYGLGSARPVARKRGKITTTGSLSLYPVEIDSIQKSTTDGNIMAIAPFDVNLVVVPKNGGNTKVVVLKNTEFMKNAIGFDIEDVSGGAVDIPVIISHIVWK